MAILSISTPMKRRRVYKSALSTHAVNTGHEFPDMTLKNTYRLVTIVDTRETVHICERDIKNNVN